MLQIQNQKDKGTMKIEQLHCNRRNDSRHQGAIVIESCRRRFRNKYDIQGGSMFGDEEGGNKI